MKSFVVAMAVLLFALAVPVSTVAQANKSEFMAIGYGATSCGTWTKARASNLADAQIYGGWVYGFLSAYNAFGPLSVSNVAHGTDNNGLLGWIDNYCQTLPLDTLVTASFALISELRKRAGL